MIALACLVTDLNTGIELACKLCRSEVAVNLRTSIPAQPRMLDDNAPFEILVINSAQGTAKGKNELENEISELIQWLHDENTFRYALVHGDSDVSKLTNTTDVFRILNSLDGAYGSSKPDGIIDITLVSDIVTSALSTLGINNICHFIESPTSSDTPSSPEANCDAPTIDTNSSLTNLSASINEHFETSNKALSLAIDSKSDTLKIVRATERITEQAS